jgi:hypothetical protein
MRSASNTRGTDVNAKTGIRIAASTATAVLIGLTSVVGVSASTAPTPGSGALLTTLKQKCDSAVQKRETALTADVSHINAATGLTSGDKSALLATESSDASGLTALDATIQSDTTLAQAKADCQKIVTQYRVYVVFEPQVHLVIAADQIGAVSAKISTLAGELQQKLGSNPNPTVQAALTDLQKQVSSAQSAVNGLSATLLAQTPAGYPGTTTTFKSALSSIKSARSDLEQARSDVETIKNALQSSGGSSASPTPSV